MLHHYRPGEDADPDLVERNLGWLRAAGLPRGVKRAVVGALAAGISAAHAQTPCQTTG